MAGFMLNSPKNQVRYAYKKHVCACFVFKLNEDTNKSKKPCSPKTLLFRQQVQWFWHYFYGYPYPIPTKVYNTWCNNNATFAENYKNVATKSLEWYIFGAHDQIVMISTKSTKFWKLNLTVHGRSMRYSNDIHPPFMKKSIWRQSILYTGYKY